jgi:hypothetical protein
VRLQDFMGNSQDFRVYEDSKPPTFEEKSKPKKKQNLQD